MRKLLLALLVLSFLLTAFSCRQRNADFVTVSLSEKFSAFDTLTSTAAPDAAAERVKALVFNALVKKDANFDYVGELAKEINSSPDGTVVTFVLHDGVKFHNGRDFTSADVKYTFDQLFKSNGFKAAAFYDTVPIGKPEASKPGASPSPALGSNADAKQAAPAAAPETKTQRLPHILSIATPDPKTVVFMVARPALRNQLLSNLVAIPIIPEGSVGQQKDSPVGSGPFKFVAFDAGNNIVELAANTEYWDGVPKIPKLRVKTVTDANSLQAELQTGGVDIAPLPSNLPPDTLKSMADMPNLRVDKYDGSNIYYLVFNTASAPLNNVKVRQAIGYAIDRQKIVSELLFDQAKLAHSILPPQSWAYSPGTQYEYNPEKAKQLLQEAGYKNEPISFKYGSGNAAVNQYAQVIQSSLNDVGLNVQIETLEVNTIRQQLAQGQFQVYTGQWIGGNQDPIFLRDLFSSTKIPGGSVSCCNRSRYVNAEVDKSVEDAINDIDRARAKDLYGRAWSVISADLPLLPLWYPANMVVSNKRIGNIKVSASGDWSFIKDITVD